jgi:hypothetical protein
MELLNHPTKSLSKHSLSRLLPLVVVLGLTASSCSFMKELGQAVSNLSRCSFKLDGVSDFQLAGISLSGKSKLNLLDAAQAVASFGKGQLPATFTLNIAVENPNTGTEGTSKSTATMTSLAWSLRIDDTPTISGNIPEPIEIPGNGQQKVIPLRMNLDLLQFFRDKGYEKIVTLALALGGVQGSASRITLRAKPTITTSIGPITYPGEIDIIDKEFRK